MLRRERTRTRNNSQTRRPTETLTSPPPHAPLSLIGIFTAADAAGAVWGCADAYWLDCLCTIIETAGLNAEQTRRPAAIQQHVFIIFSKSPLIRRSSKPFLISTCIYIFIYLSFIFVICSHVLWGHFYRALIKPSINLLPSKNLPLFSQMHQQTGPTKELLFCPLAGCHDISASFIPLIGSDSGLSSPASKRPSRK